jgi:hypothetical protein
MAHVLIFHPDDAVRLALRKAIEPAGHVVEHLGDAGEVVGLVEHQEAIQDPFDVVLLPDAGLLGALGARRVDHGVALVGTTTAEPFLGAVDAGAPADGIVAQLAAALGRRERYLGRLETWDLALDYLARVGMAEQRAVVAAHRPSVPGLDSAEPAVAAALQASEDAANAALQGQPGTLEAALAPLAPYQATPTFWTQLRTEFAHARVRALALLATLRRLDADKLAHGRVVAPGHFTLPVGGTHQVFFRWSNGRRVLEAFAPTREALATAERLTHAAEPPVNLVEAPLPATP